MTNVIPPALKAVVPYLKSALQLSKVEPIMSYYCKLYVLQQGIALQPKGSRDEACKRFLITLMNELEEEKRKLGTILEQQGMGKEYVETFALRVFQIADDEDRQGNANKGTAQNFFAAANFMDVISQFGELTEEMQEKQRYARWKAADINKALKAGLKPTPGPPMTASEDAALEEDLRRLEQQQQQQQQQQGNEQPQQSSTDFPTFPSIPTQQQKPTQPQQFQPPPPMDFPSVPTQPTSQQQRQPPPFDFPTFPTPTQQKPASQQQPPPPMDFPSVPSQPTQQQHQATKPQTKQTQQQPTKPPQPQQQHYSQNESMTGQVDPGKIQDAQKFCKFAASALNFDDVSTATKNLLLALTALTGREYVPK